MHSCEDSDFSTLSSLESPKQNRFQALQEKLELLGRVTASNRDTALREKVAARLQKIQERLAEERVVIEENIEGMKDRLAEARMNIQKREKHCNCLVRKRWEDIKHIKRQLAVFIQEQNKEQKEEEEMTREKFIQSIGVVSQMIRDQIEERNNAVQKLEKGLQTALPRLNQCIRTSHKHSQYHFQRKVSEMSQLSSSLKHQLSSQQEHHQRSILKLGEMIQKTIDQLQSDLLTQRKQRRRMKEQLEFAILTASQRANDVD